MECLGVHRNYVVQKFYKIQLSELQCNMHFPVSNVDWSTQQVNSPDLTPNVLFSVELP